MKDKLIFFVRYIREHSHTDYFLFLLLGLVSLTWFKGDFYISTGDFFWSLDFSKFLRITSYVWDETFSMGVLASRQLASFFPYAFYGHFFQKIFGNSLVYEKVLFYTLFSFSGISFYFLLKQVGVRRISRILASIFYMVNPFSLIVVWYVNHGNIQSFYAFFPLVVALYIKIFQDEISISYANLLSFFLLIGVSFVNPVFLFIVLFTLLFYSGYLLFITVLTGFCLKTVKKILFKTFLFVSIFLLLRLNWLLPFLINFQNEYLASGNEGGGFFSEAFNARLNSIQIHDAFRLMGLWSFFSQYGGDLFYRWSPVFKTPLFVFLSFLMGVVLLFGFMIKNKNRYRDLLFWYLLFLIAVIVNVSFSFIVFGRFFDFVYKKLPLLEMGFRGGFLKHGFLLALSYIVIFGVGLDYLYRIVRNKIFLFLIPILILGFPVFTGQLFRSSNRVLKSALIKIPDDYFQLKKWDSKFKLDQRYYVLPPITLNYNVSFNWDYGYSGADILRWFVNSPVINIYTESILSTITDSLGKQDTGVINRLLSLLSVKRIILHEDSDFFSLQKALSREENYIDKYLATLDNKINFGKLRIFELDERYFTPKIFIPGQTFFVTGNPSSIADLLSLDNLEGSYGMYFNSQRVLTRPQDISFQDGLMLRSADQIIIPFVSRDYRPGRKSDEELYLPFHDQDIEIPKAASYEVWLRKSSKLAENKDFIIDLSEKQISLSVDLEATKSGSWLLAGITEFPYGIHKTSILLNGKKTMSVYSGDIMLRYKNIADNNKSPYVEYKKINPTRYVVRIHQCQNPFLLVFSERFSKDWQAYVKNPKFKTSAFAKATADKQSSKLDEYKILNGNEEDQVSKEELVSYLDNDWVSAVGEGKKTEFISRIMKNTVQNNNLPGGGIWETYFVPFVRNFPSPLSQKLLDNKIYFIPEQNHLKVNTFANAWRVDARELDKLGIVKPEGDGYYDFEMIIEFDSQKYVHLGMAISIIILGMIILISLIRLFLALFDNIL